MKSWWVPALVLMVALGSPWRLPQAWADGAWTPQGIPVCVTPQIKDQIQLVTDGSGGAICFWDDNRGGQYDIYGQKITAAGTAAWAPNGQVICGAPDHQWYPAPMADGAGGAFVDWLDLRSGQYQVYMQHLNGTGAAQWTANGIPVSTAPGNRSYNQICTDGSGGALAAWTDYRNGADGNIYAQRVNASGVPQWNYDGTTVCAFAGDKRWLMMVADGQHGAFLAWVDTRRGMGLPDLYAQHIDAGGNTLWAQAGLPIYAGANVNVFQICGDGSGGLYAAWADSRTLTFNIYAQHLDAFGNKLWAANGVTLCAEPTMQNNPQLLPDGAGGVFVAWEDSRSGTPDIYAQRLNAAGSLLWPASGVAACSAPNVQTELQIQPDGFGGLFLSWNDYRNQVTTGRDVYAQRLNNAGTILWQPDGVAVSTAPYNQFGTAATFSNGLIMAWKDARYNIGGEIDVFSQKIVRPLPTVTGILPAQGPFGVTVPGVAMTGYSFQDESGQVTYLKLTRSGQPDIPASNLQVLDAGHMRGDFTLPASPAAIGAWSVVAYDSLGQTSNPSAAFFSVFQPVVTSLTWVAAPGAQIFTGTQNNWVGQVNVSASGYDYLQTLTVSNLGSADAGTDLSALSLWYLANGGSGGVPFDPAQAQKLGTFTATGAKTWTLALSQKTADGDALYLAADIPGNATIGRTLRFALLPNQAGFQYAGTLPPLTLVSLSEQTISLGVTLQVDLNSQAPANVTRGQLAVPLGRIRLANASGGILTITSVLMGLTNLAGAAQPLESAFSALRLESGGSLLATATAPFGTAATFSLGTFLNLTAQAQTAFDVSGDIAPAPSTGAFRLGLSNGQCFNQGGYLAAPVAGKSFPLLTNPVNIRTPDLAGVFSSFPNPFQPGKAALHISYYLASAGTAEVSIHTLSHQPVIAFSESQSQAGTYETVWDGRNGAGQWVRGGIYILRIEVHDAGGARPALTRKIAVVR